MLPALNHSTRVQNVEHRRRVAFMRIIGVLAVGDLWATVLCMIYIPGSWASIFMATLSIVLCSTSLMLCHKNQVHWAGVVSSFGHSILIIALCTTNHGVRLPLVFLLFHTILSGLASRRSWTVGLGLFQMVAVTLYCTYIPSIGHMGEHQPTYFLPLILSLIAMVTPLIIAGEYFNGLMIQEMNKTKQQLEESRNQERMLREEAEKANAVKGRFLATMSHELRTPLNAIIGYSEMIRDDYDVGDPLDKQVHEDIDRINNAGQHLLRLISSLLDLSKIEAGQMTVHPETLCLQQMLVHVIDEVNAIARRHNTTIVQDVPSKSIEVVSDHVMLTQIVTNLMSNALKFSRGGTVTLRLRDCTEHVELEVEDTGIGMSPEQLEHVFDAFIQADATTTRTYGGTGLGLSLVKHFGVLIGAEIHATSTLDTGSTFHVRIPKTMPVAAAKAQSD